MPKYKYSPAKMIKEFFRLEAAAGILLALTALIAILIKNSPLQELYGHFLNTPVVVQIGSLAIDKPLLLWINDGLMAIFFLLVGLEIKREILEGQLSSKEQVILPVAAAFGGLMIPALIYTYFNYGSQNISGWAIPAATDIAFALGVISLLGKRVPQSLKVCLVAIAIIDDLAAIIIIALFYTKSLSLVSLGLASIGILGLFILNKRKVTKIAPYIIIGVFLWVCVLKSGVHATLAGVVIALFIPLRIKNDAGSSPARALERDLHPWVAYAILPIFAFVNAGVSLKGLSLEMLLHPVVIGITLGLFLGKQIGIMLASSIFILLRICHLPKNTNWLQYYAMSLITGIGFTMSLFIGALAFDDAQTQTYVRLGVISGSVLSALSGYFLLKLACNKEIKKLTN